MAKIVELSGTITTAVAASVTQKTGSIRGKIQAIRVEYSGDLVTALGGGGLDIELDEVGGPARNIMDRANDTASFTHIPSLASQAPDGTASGDTLVPGVPDRALEFTVELNGGGNLPADETMTWYITVERD